MHLHLDQRIRQSESNFGSSPKFGLSVVDDCEHLLGFACVLHHAARVDHLCAAGVLYLVVDAQVRV